MTTDPTPEACCEHGEAIEKLAAELRRANQLLADLVEVRRGNTVRTCDEVHPEYDVHHPGGHPRPEEIQAFARGGYKVRITGAGGPGDATTGSVEHDFKAEEVIEELASPQFKEPRR